MPPKKVTAPGQKPANSVQGETDLTDAAALPMLNDFIFTTLYAFKYRMSQKKVEEALRLELDLTLQPQSTDPDIMDA